MAQDAQLISQAGQVESLASDGLVSVSTGAGQPQKNMELAKFADSLGSSVPLQQTTEQVSITGLYARTSDGKMVELTKESVASVMAGLIGAATTEKEGLAPSWIVKGCTSNLSLIQIDFNTYEGNTMVLCYGANSPDGNTTRYFMLIQKEDVGRMKYQVAQNYENGLVYRRTYSAKVGEWSPWAIDNFGYNTLAELSSGVAKQMGAPMMWKTTSRLESTKTPIPVNGGTGVHAYVYIISYNWSSDDATFYEYGIIRTGHSGNYVFKNIISEHKRDGTSFSVSSDSDGYVTINTTSSPLPNIHIRIMG